MKTVNYEMNEKDVKWIEHYLKKLDFVNWDRYGVRKNKTVTIYGWIDRPKDNYKDFILMIFFTDHNISYISSSAEHGRKIHKILYDSEEESFGECQRVEDRFKIKNCIVLKNNE